MQNKTSTKIKGNNRPILTITGSDSTGVSGVQADIKTMAALGAHAVTAITSITVQTTLGIQQFHDLPTDIVASQIEAIMNDIQPQVVKVGLIRTKSALQVIVDALRKYKPKHIVYDPVVYSSQGELLMSTEVVQDINSHLLPLCTLIIDRKKYLSVRLRKHEQGSSENKDEKPAENTAKKQIPDFPLHGLSNSFSSAVAVYLNQGESPQTAIQHARAFISTQTLRAMTLQGAAPERYNAFLDDLDKHIRTNSDVAFYADRLNVSSRYLAQVCRRMAGKSPKAIIDEQLMRAVEVQLSTTTSSLQEIARTFGFSSQAHFTKFFKKQRGITPTAFRAEIFRKKMKTEKA